MIPGANNRKTANPERRDPRVHRAILDATVYLLETIGYKKLSIEAIASRAGVGKQTIYRWWSNKAEIVMEAYTAAGEERAPGIDTGSVVGDIEAILVPVFEINSDPNQGPARAVKSMMAEAQLDPQFRAEFMKLIMSWHGPLIDALERAKARGELRPDADSATLVDIILGATWYRTLLEHAPLDKQYAHDIATSVIEGNRPR